MDEGIQFRLQALRAFQMSGDEFYGRDFLSFVQFECLRDGAVEERGHETILWVTRRIWQVDQKWSAGEGKSSR